MFGSGWSEMLLSVSVGRIFSGPKKVPNVSHEPGLMSGKACAKASAFQLARNAAADGSGVTKISKFIQAAAILAKFANDKLVLLVSLRAKSVSEAVNLSEVRRVATSWKPIPRGSHQENGLRVSVGERGIPELMPAVLSVTGLQAKLPPPVVELSEVARRKDRVVAQPKSTAVRIVRTLTKQARLSFAKQKNLPTNTFTKQSKQCVVAISAGAA